MFFAIFILYIIFITFLCTNIYIKTYKKMELKENIYDLIDNQATRLQLALALHVSELTIRNYIRIKSNNLTKAAALQVMKRTLKLPLTQILTEPLAFA